MKAILQILIATLMVFVVACVVPFDPKLKGGTPYIVFEGTLTDQPGPHYFTLSLSAGYNSKESVFDRTVNAAKVWLTDSKGVRTDLIDLSKGKFSTPEGFKGQIGNSYILHVLNAGLQYESSAETMRFVPEINKVYAEYNQTLGKNPKNRGYFNVYIDTKDSSTEGDYYRWFWKGYEKVKVCDLYTPPGSIVTYLRYCCDDCWDIHQCIGCIIMASDKLINGRVLAKQRVAQIPYDDIKPYYIAIEQMSLSKEAYNYWSSIDAQANNSGGIFDASPATIRGNIKVLSADATPMLGFFQVSAVTQKIAYIQRNNVGYEPFSKVFSTSAVYPKCTYCQESPYRTAKRPLNWVD